MRQSPVFMRLPAILAMDEEEALALYLKFCEGGETPP
jgi:hypothetical protein